MAALAFLAIFALDVPFPYIVLAAGIIGYIGSHFIPGKFVAGGHHGGSDKSFGAALIDDNTPVPEHARFKWSRLLAFLLIGLLIGTGVMVLLVSSYGWEGTLTQSTDHGCCVRWFCWWLDQRDIWPRVAAIGGCGWCKCCNLVYIFTLFSFYPDWRAFG